MNTSNRIGELWRLPRVITEIGQSRAWLYKHAKAGTFPRPLKNGRSSVWSSAAVEEYKRAVAAGEKWFPGWRPEAAQ